MRYLILLLLLVAGSCESHSFDSDKRQLIAKDEIRRLVSRGRSFDITAFNQDTIGADGDSIAKFYLRYNLQFQYIDSVGNLQKKKGVVLFTPDGLSVINSQIVEPDQQQH